MSMKTKAELETELAATRARRKPALTDAQKHEHEEATRLQAELDAEYRALRAEENADIVAKFAPTKAREFFDFDPNMVHPATIEHNGIVCTLHSRFVVRHATADDMEVFDDAKKAAEAAQKDPSRAATLTKAAESTTIHLGRKCIVYPEQIRGNGSAQHYLDIEASLWYFGGAGMALGNAAAQLGGLHALARQQKS
jgi:hypothetical protein